MLGNEPLSKWSLVTNSQSKLWGGMLMKCQSCHFISSNYRLACRPFNDHLQRSLQCIRGVQNLSLSLPFTLSKNTLAYIIMNLHKHRLGKRYTHTHWYTNTQKYTLPPHITLFFSKPLTSCLFAMCKTRQLSEPASLGLPIKNWIEHL